jgi:hypothetical protein
LQQSPAQAAANRSAFQKSPADSQLATDLAEPGGPLGSPLSSDDVMAIALNADLVSALTDKLGPCLQNIVITTPTGDQIGQGVSVKPTEACADLKDTYNKDKASDRADLVLDGQTYTFVTWDAADSDDDFSDLGVYDQNGRRVAVVKNIEECDTAFDCAAAAANVKVPEVAGPFVAKTEEEKDQVAAAAGTDPFDTANEVDFATSMLNGDGYQARLRQLLEAAVSRNADGKLALKNKIGDAIVPNPQDPSKNLFLGTIDLGRNSTATFQYGDVEVFHPGGPTTGIFADGNPIDFNSYVVFVDGDVADVAIYNPQGGRAIVVKSIAATNALEALVAIAGAHVSAQ